MLRKCLYKVILLSVFLFASCSTIMDDEICTGDATTRKVTFKIMLNDAARYTRAAWGDGYEAGESVSYDNRIAYNAVRVLFYTLDNNYIGEATDLIYWSLSDNSYKFSGDITNLGLVHGVRYKVVVLANTPLTTTNINDLYFELSDIVYPDGYIPMWGVQDFTSNETEVLDIGTVELLRAMAKVEVVLSNEMIAKGYSLKKVSLLHHNTQGNCLPAGWQNVDRTSQLDIMGCMNTRHSHSSDVISLAEVETGKRYWVYIPEYNVLHTATNRPNMSVTIANGADLLEFPAAIKFGSYDEAGKFIENSDVNIVRNHIYRFNITAIAGGVELEYSVLGWEDGGEWNRGEFAYPTYHNPMVPDYLDPTQPITQAPVMKYNNTATPEDDAFVAWFKLMKPAGQQWVPTIDMPGTDYSIKVYNHLGQLLDNPADWVASDDWYKVVVLPLKPENAGVVVKFGITYHQDWMPDGKSVYLFINGKADEIAWPQSGNDPNYIEIKQI